MNLLGALYFIGPSGLQQMTLQVFSSLSTFTLTPIPLFILMGELMFHSGIANNTIDVMDKWLGRLPGRLSLLATGAGVLFAALSGSTLANTAMLGTVLLPEMQKRGYKTPDGRGPHHRGRRSGHAHPPILPRGRAGEHRAHLRGEDPGRRGHPGAPPGGDDRVLRDRAVLARPLPAPRYEVDETSFGEKILGTVKYVLPLGVIIFMVLGFMLLGIATPTEAASSGAIGTIIVTILYRQLSWKMIKASIIGTLEITVMVFMIIAGSNSFSSLLAYTGATRGLLGLVEGLQVHPIIILIGMQVIVFFLGCLMETVSIMMICMPIFMPIVKMLGFDPVWFGVIMLVNFETGFITPPFGMLLFVMKGVAPQLTMKEIVFAGLPFVVIELIAMAILIAFPPLVLWLPGIMGSIPTRMTTP